MPVGSSSLRLQKRLLTAGIDFHTSNLLFALSVDIDSWTVQELYAALGGEPVTVPFSAALGSRPVPVETPTHTQVPCVYAAGSEALGSMSRLSSEHPCH